VGALTLLHFPMGVDGPEIPLSLTEDADEFYEAVYTEPAESSGNKYVRTGQLAAHIEEIEPKLRRFVADHHLENARTLEVGAGSGSLQDVVADYTGLDIAASAAQNFHKPFVQGSATQLPFRDDEFDLYWTIWTLEHVPNPERALNEARRVVRSGGYLYLYPAWNNPTWAPQGYPVRPDSQLTWQEIAVKYSLLIREADWFKSLYRYPIRMIRAGSVELGGPSQLRYHKIDANFETYWMPDSDAVYSIDCYEAQLWFESRGDEVSNHGGEPGAFSPCAALVVRVNKQAAAPPRAAILR
jgi:SAM-dependent methyltransferase